MCARRRLRGVARGRADTNPGGICQVTCCVHAAAASSADKKVFPKFDVVGWYSTGSELQDVDLELQRTVRAVTLTRRRVASSALMSPRHATQMTAITESPVFVLFSPTVRSASSKDLPITLYESGALSVTPTASASLLCAVYRKLTTRAMRARAARGKRRACSCVCKVRVHNRGAPSSCALFTEPSTHRLPRACHVPQTGEAERVAVDHVARIVPTDASSSSAQRTFSGRCAEQPHRRLTS